MARRSRSVVAALAGILVAVPSTLDAKELEEGEQLRAIGRLVAAMEAGDVEAITRKVASVQSLRGEATLARTPRDFAARVAGCKGSAPTKWRPHLDMYALDLTCRDGQSYRLILDAEYKYPYIAVAEFETAAEHAARMARPPPAPPAPPPVLAQRAPTEAERQTAIAERHALVRAFADYVVAGAADDPPQALAELGRVTTNRRDAIHKVDIVEQMGTGIAALRTQLADLKPIIGSLVGHECESGDITSFCKFKLDNPQAVLMATFVPFQGKIRWIEFRYATLETARRDAAME